MEINRTVERRPHVARHAQWASASRMDIARGALIVGLATMLALALAYQVRSIVTLDVGGKFDGPFVEQFHDIERDSGQTYRWTRTPARIEFPALNIATPWTLRLRVNGYRPDRVAHVAVRLNDQVVRQFDAAGEWQTVSFDLNLPSPKESGDNTFTITSDTFVPKDEIADNEDSRALGIAVDWLELEPVRGANAIGSDTYWIDFGDLLAPPLLPSIAWGLAFALLYAAARRVHLRPQFVNGIFAALIVTLALGFAIARIYVGVFTTPFLYLAFGIALLAVIASSVTPRVFRALGLGVDASQSGAVIGIALTMMAFKLGGILYPQFHSSDVRFHAHRLEFVASGRLFFTSQLPDAAQRTVPYPPALYVFLSPLASWISDYDRLIEIANVLVDVVAVFAIYLLARRLFQDVRVASTAAFLFAFNPVTFYIYSWGNHTNIFGQFAATLLLAVLLIEPGAASRRSRLQFGILGLAAFFFLVAALAHLGVFLSILLWIPLVVVSLFVFMRRDQTQSAVALLALFGIGILLAFILYYAEYLDLLAREFQRYASDLSAGRASGEGARQALSLVTVGNQLRAIANQLGIALLGAGLLGLPRLWRNLDARRRALAFSWLLVAVGFAVIALASSFSARFTLWAAPVLALSGGLVLARLSDKSRAGVWAALAACALALGQTLWAWLDRILYAYH